MAEDARAVRGLDPWLALRDVIESIPDEGHGDNPYLAAAEAPAVMVTRMLKDTLMSIWNLADASGKAAEGRTDVSVDPLDVLNLAGGSLIRGVPKGTAGIFGTRLPLGTADQTLSRGPRGHLYHEVSDENATIVKDPRLPKNKTYDLGGRETEQELQLNQVLSHPELYELYPDIASTRVVWNPDLVHMQGSYDPSTFTIEIGPGTQDLRETLLHEVQHRVQEVDSYYATLAGEMPRSGGIDPQSAGMEAKELARRVNRLLDSGFPVAEPIRKAAKLVTTMTEHDLYYGNPGEREAWLVGERKNMSTAERRASPPNFDTATNMRTKQSVPVMDIEGAAMVLSAKEPKLPEKPVFGKRKAPPAQDGNTNLTDEEKLQKYIEETKQPPPPRFVDKLDEQQLIEESIRQRQAIERALKKPPENPEMSPDWKEFWDQYEKGNAS